MVLSRPRATVLTATPHRYTAHGFTLIELSVVLVVVGLLLGGLLLALSTQVEVSKVRQTQKQLEEIKEAILGFLAAQGRLPCPAAPDSDGQELRALTPDATESDPTKKVIWCATAPGLDGIYGTTDDATFQHGFVPAATLGIGGARNDDGLLVDAWGSPIRYSVSGVDRDPAAPTDVTKFNRRWDFFVEAELRALGPPYLFPDLNICGTAAGTGAGAGIQDVCLDAPRTVVGSYTGQTDRPGVPFVVYSLGPDGETFTDLASISADELENAGEKLAVPRYTLGGGPSGDIYLIAADRAFVSHGRSGSLDSPDALFDDLVEWISPNVLYSHMIRAGRLP